MDDDLLWYLSGAVDSLANLKVKITKHDQYQLGYRVFPELTISRPDEQTALFGLLDEYCTEVGAHYYLDDSGTSSTRLVIEKPEDIRRFLEPIIGGFIQQHEKADVFLSRVLDEVETTQPKSKREFIEVVELAEEHGAISSRSKYTADYFRDRWETERGNIREA